MTAKVILAALCVVALASAQATSHTSVARASESQFVYDIDHSNPGHWSGSAYPYGYGGLGVSGTGDITTGAGQVIGGYGRSGIAGYGGYGQLGPTSYGRYGHDIGYGLRGATGHSGRLYNDLGVASTSYGGNTHGGYSAVPYTHGGYAGYGATPYSHGGVTYGHQGGSYGSALPYTQAATLSGYSVPNSYRTYAGYGGSGYSGYGQGYNTYNHLTDGIYGGQHGTW